MLAYFVPVNGVIMSVVLTLCVCECYAMCMCSISFVVCGILPTRGATRTNLVFF